MDFSTALYGVTAILATYLIVWVIVRLIFTIMFRPIRYINTVLSKSLRS